MLTSQQIVFEDNHLLIVNKPAGFLVQGDETGDVCLVDVAKQYIKEKYNKPGNVFCGLVHRLDRPVSGLVVLAKTSKGLERMNAIFQGREVEKRYLAVLMGKPDNETATLVHKLVKDEKKNLVKAFAATYSQGQLSELTYRFLQVSGANSLLEVLPKTGRSHQIRVQLASMKTPIVGDLKYGAPQPNEDASICLHAFSLKFTHPVTKENLYIKTQPPMVSAWKKFEKHILSLS